MVLERADLARLHLPRAEVVEDRRLDLRVDDPVVAVGLGDPHLAAVERGDRLSVVTAPSSRISAARSHSACVGTSAKPHVALAGRAEERAGRDEDAVLEQAARERPPTGRRRRARGRTSRRRRRAGGPCASSSGQERLALAPVDLAHVVDVLLVRPGGDRRALHELLRRRPDRRPERAQRVRDVAAARRRSPSGSRSSTSASRAC